MGACVGARSAVGDVDDVEHGGAIPADHPIRRIRVVVDAVLAELDDVFDGMYAAGGRRSVPPETLLKSTVLMAMYSIRSERAFCERLNYDLLFKRRMSGCRPGSLGDENGVAARRRRNHLVLELVFKRDAGGSLGTLECCFEHESEFLFPEPPAGGTTSSNGKGEVDGGAARSGRRARCPQADVVACVRSPGPGRSRRAETREFETFIDDLERLRDWLVAEGVTHVAMEATGIYWKPVWFRP